MQQKTKVFQIEIFARRLFTGALTKIPHAQRYL